MTVSERLFAIQDLKYRDFEKKLIPNIDSERIIGVRLPLIKAIADEMVKNNIESEFIGTLPHKYLEEDHLHSFIIAQIFDFDECINKLEKFLPYIDNWSVCDSLRPKCFKKHKDELSEKIRKWIKSEDTYTVRFAIEMLMVHFLDDYFSDDHFVLVSEVNSDNYYIKMAVAWYFATALSMQYEKALEFIEHNLISDIWTHNKAIQKALESNKISTERKMYLKSLKR